MIQNTIKNYNSQIETIEDMIIVLTQYRNDLMAYYSKTFGFQLDEALPCLDMIIRLDKIIRHYEWLKEHQGK